MHLHLSSQTWNRDRTPRRFTISQAVVYALQEDAGGEVENANRTASNAVDTLALLVERLHARGVVTDEDVLAIVPAFQPAPKEP